MRYLVNRDRATDRDFFKCKSLALVSRIDTMNTSNDPENECIVILVCLTSVPNANNNAINSKALRSSRFWLAPNVPSGDHGTTPFDLDLLDRFLDDTKWSKRLMSST